MLIVGLTGNLGSGKTTVCKLLRRKRAVVFDCDQQIHQYYRNKRGAVYRAIAKAFPEALSSGRIRRDKLSTIVFSDPKNLKKLEKIIHPVVIKDLKSWIKNCRKQVRSKIAVAEVPLLFEKKLQSHFDLVILVKMNRKLQIARLNKIYGFPQVLTRKRLSFYRPLREKINRADFVIDNSQNIKMLTKEVDLLWKRLKEK